MGNFWCKDTENKENREDITDSTKDTTVEYSQNFKIILKTWNHIYSSLESLVVFNYYADPAYEITMDLSSMNEILFYGGNSLEDPFPFHNWDTNVDAYLRSIKNATKREKIEYLLSSAKSMFLMLGEARKKFGDCILLHNYVK